MVECLGASNFSNYIFKSNKTRSINNLRCYAFSFFTVYQPYNSYFLEFSKNSLLKVASICLLLDHHKKKLCFLVEFKPSCFFACFNHVQTRDHSTWAIIKVAASVTYCHSLCFINFQLEGHLEDCNEVESLSLVQRLMEFEPETF